MSAFVDIDDMNKELQRILNEYKDDVEEEVAKEIDLISKDVRDIVKEHAPVRTGKYKKSIIAKKGGKTDNYYYRVVASNEEMYRLTHLLERQHLTRNGITRTRAFPHFKYGQEYLDKNFIPRVLERLKKIK